MATRKKSEPKTDPKTEKPSKRPPAVKRSVKPPAPAEASKRAGELAILCSAAGLEKKALDVEIIDVSGRVDYADYLVLMTGSSDRHVASLVQGIDEAMRKAKVKTIAIEGLPTAEWVLIDLGDVVAHVFQSDSRSLYDIDGLWMDARRVPVPDRAK